MKKLIEYADESGVEIIIKGFSCKPSLPAPLYSRFLRPVFFTGLAGSAWLAGNLLFK